MYVDPNPKSMCLPSSTEKKKRGMEVPLGGLVDALVCGRSIRLDGRSV